MVIWQRIGIGIAVMAVLFLTARAFRVEQEKHPGDLQYNDELPAVSNKAADIESDKIKAAKFDIDAMTRYGIRICGLNRAGAIKLWKYAAKAGDVVAGYCLFWVQSNKEENTGYLEKAAKKGFAYAQYDMGVNLYWKGNKVEAAEWFLKAARQGFAKAEFAYAKLCEQGIGVAKDPERAFRFYKSAAEKNHRAAQRAVARCYENGIGVAPDKRLAKYWWHRCHEEATREMVGDMVTLL